MAEKTAIQIHYSKLIQFMDSCFSNEEVGEMFRAIIDYEVNENKTKLEDRAMNSLVKSVYFDIDQNKVKYIETCERNKKNQEIRWERERQRKGKNTRAQPEKQKRSREKVEQPDPRYSIMQEGEADTLEPDEPAEYVTMPDYIRESLDRRRPVNEPEYADVDFEGEGYSADEQNDLLTMYCVGTTYKTGEKKGQHKPVRTPDGSLYLYDNKTRDINKYNPENDNWEYCWRID